MGNSGSTVENDLDHHQHYSSSVAHSSIGPDGQVKTIEEIFTGEGQNGNIDGTGHRFTQVFPSVGALGFSLIAVLTIAVFSVMIIKFQRLKLIPSNSSPSSKENTDLKESNGANKV